jgi:hypothetical protein
MKRLVCKEDVGELKIRWFCEDEDEKFCTIEVRAVIYAFYMEERRNTRLSRKVTYLSNKKDKNKVFKKVRGSMLYDGEGCLYLAEERF